MLGRLVGDLHGALLLHPQRPHDDVVHHAVHVGPEIALGVNRVTSKGIAWQHLRLPNESGVLDLGGLCGG